MRTESAPSGASARNRFDECRLTGSRFARRSCFFFSRARQIADQKDEKQQREKADGARQNLQNENGGRLVPQQFPEHFPKKNRVEIFARNFLFFASLFTHRFSVSFAGVGRFTSATFARRRFSFVFWFLRTVAGGSIQVWLGSHAEKPFFRTVNRCRKRSRRNAFREKKRGEIICRAKCRAGRTGGKTRTGSTATTGSWRIFAPDGEFLRQLFFANVDVFRKIVRLY